MAPINRDILNRSIRKAASQQRKRVVRWIVLIGVRVAAEKMILRTGVEIDLYVVLVGVELRTVV